MKKASKLSGCSYKYDCVNQKVQRRLSIGPWVQHQERREIAQNEAKVSSNSSFTVSASFFMKNDEKLLKTRKTFFLASKKTIKADTCRLFDKMCDMA